MKLTTSNVNKVLNANGLVKENIKYSVDGFRYKSIKKNGKFFRHYNPRVEHSPMDCTNAKYQRITHYITKMVNIIEQNFICNVQWNDTQSVTITKDNNKIIILTDTVQRPDYPDYTVVGIDVIGYNTIHE